MKRLLLTLFLITALAGCATVPTGPSEQELIREQQLRNLCAGLSCHGYKPPVGESLLAYRIANPKIPA
jgi:hypothetical protein